MDFQVVLQTVGSEHVRDNITNLYGAKQLSLLLPLSLKLSSCSTTVVAMDFKLDSSQSADISLLTGIYRQN